MAIAVDETPLQLVSRQRVKVEFVLVVNTAAHDGDNPIGQLF